MVSLDALMQGIASTRDTLIMKQVVPEHGLLDQIVAVCTVVTTIALTALSIFAVPAAYRFRGTYKKANELMDKIRGDVEPIARHMSVITENLSAITTTIRNDVAMVNDTITSANERVHRAIEQAEERLNEFNALLAVVQEEAEDVFVSAAATVRGVRTGASAFRGRDGRRGRDLASDELDAADPAEETDDSIEGEEDGDGDYGNPGHPGDSEPSAEALSAVPRLRPRARGQRRRGA